MAQANHTRTEKNSAPTNRHFSNDLDSGRHGGGISGVQHGILYNEHMEGDGEMIFRHACKLGCEGIVSRRADSPYRSGRSRDWLKVKSPAAIEQQRIRSENWNK
jgi:hypothetical protein